MRKDLPPGVTLQSDLQPAGAAIVHRMAAELIVGYAVPSTAIDRDRVQGLDRLFAGTKQRPKDSFVIAATDPAGNILMGGAVIEPFPADTTLELERARDLSRYHYVLAAMFVVPKYRRLHIGETLLDEATVLVLREQGRYLDGFVDVRTDAVDFYRRAGAIVCELNTGLPPRRPTNTPMSHVNGANGHWFYVDGYARHHNIMQCSTCQQPMVYHAENGGWMDCPQCSPTTAPTDQ